MKPIVFVAALLTAQVDPQAIQRMAATERAFAAATAEVGVRDGFLAFFAADAVTFGPGADGSKVTVTPARPGLEQLPPTKLPLGVALMWAPFTGHVSTDGTIGWLTGGYARLSVATQDLVGKGAYFSVWKRQADGTWRVWLDEGIGLPDVWRDASPFRVAPEPDTGTAGSASDTIDAVERAVASGGAAWRAYLSEGLRLHRDGVMPLVGRDAVTQWATGAWTTVHYHLVKTDTAGSGDLGVALGGYDATTPGGPEHGTWIRMWKRDVTGRWRVVFETSKKTA